MAFRPFFRSDFEKGTLLLLFKSCRFRLVERPGHEFLRESGFQKVSYLTVNWYSPQKSSITSKKLVDPFESYLTGSSVLPLV